MSLTLLTKPNQDTNLNSIQCNIMMGKSDNRNTLQSIDLNFDMDNNSPPQGQKRTTNNRESSAESKAQKRSKSSPSTKFKSTSRHWLGFEALEKLVVEEKVEECYESRLIANFVKQGYSPKEVEELHNAVFSYPHVPHELYPIARPNGF